MVLGKSGAGRGLNAIADVHLNTFNPLTKISNIIFIINN
jgi:hypothetical protein